jgi:hypothetical protein
VRERDVVSARLIIMNRVMSACPVIEEIACRDPFGRPTRAPYVRRI